MINGGWKAYYGLENKCKLINLWFRDKKKLLFNTLITAIILYIDVKFGDEVSLENP